MVHHISAKNEEELNRLRGSKYLQSRTENTFIEVREKLNKNQIVLYSGTACQIAGLKQFLGKEYENLVLVDVLCHGVPRQKYGEDILVKFK